MAEIKNRSQQPTKPVRVVSHFDENRIDATPQVNDISLKIFFPFISYTRDKLGQAAVEELARHIHLNVQDLRNPHLWIPLSSATALLAWIRQRVDSEENFQAAGVYKMKESYGPLRFLIRAASPRQIYSLGFKHFSAISKFSSGHIVRHSRSRISTIYKSTKGAEESRLMCIARQAQCLALPTLWGLPPAHLNEKKCICFGDDCCEYELRLYQTKQWLPILFGAIVGGVWAFVLFVLQLSLVLGNSAWALLPFLGAIVGYIASLRRMNAENFAVSEEINEELRKHVQENAEAKSEIVAANQRQREWTRLMEEQVSERTAILENMVADINKMQAERDSEIRGYSHDLKNPFFILCMITDSLAMLRDKMDDDVWALVKEQNEAIPRMQHMLEELVNVATKSNTLIQLTVETISVPPLVDVFRRRLKAFVHGRDIRVSVFSNREAPSKIRTDRLLFDRVVDNLLTNAAKYTEQGSIIVELDGKPDFLTIKVSDTGQGIEDDKIDQIFMPGGSSPEQRKKWSHGVGLSVVVRLLAQIGGKLDIMSLPMKGTTFWAHFPVKLKIQNGADMTSPRISKLTPEDLFMKVVKVRRPNAS